MNGVFRPHLYTYRLNWARRTSWYGEMTLPCRHRIGNSSPGGLRPSTLSLGHRGSQQYWIFTNERGRNTSFLETWRLEWGSHPRSPTFQAGSLKPLHRDPRRGLDLVMSSPPGEAPGASAPGTVHVQIRTGCLLVFPWQDLTHARATGSRLWQVWWQEDTDYSYVEKMCVTKKGKTLGAKILHFFVESSWVMV